MQPNFSLSQLADSSRVWFFTFKRELDDKEESELTDSLNLFIKDWSSHGIQLEAGFDLIERNYLVVAADEERKDASGCSIDKLTRFMMEIDKTYELGLFDRLKILIEPKTSIYERIHFNDRAQFKSCNTINILASNLGSYRKHPKVKLEELYPC